MFSSHRIHEEQIKKSTQSLKALYQVRNAESVRDEKSGMVRSQVRQPEKSHYNYGESTSPASDYSRDKKLPLDLSSPQIPAMRCIRCNARIPVTDFLYTKKTGLCIPCWEEMEV
jgi:hypothetical protein